MVCFGFIVVPGVSYICFSYGSLVRFVFDGLRSSSYCLVSCFAIDLLLVAKWLFPLSRLILSGS